MNIKKISAWLFLAFFCVNFSLIAQDAGYDSCDSNEVAINLGISLKKIYVQPSQLHIITEGIFFVNNEGCLESACGVFNDSAGIYVIASRYACPVCGYIRNKDGKCRNKKCAFYRKKLLGEYSQYEKIHTGENP